MKLNLLSFLFLLSSTLIAQDVSFNMIEGGFTNGGASYEFDVVATSVTGFKMGSGQLYFNYNPAAFGENVVINGRLTVTYPDGSILATTVGSPPFQFSFYNQFIIADNQINRFSIAWQHAFSEGCLLENNIVGTDQVLFHIQLDFASEQPVLPDVCFESSASFIGQTFTACGPVACGNVDCNAFPGTQIVNEMYTCLDALPVELLSFQAKYQKPNTAFLTWETESEYQSSHFDIERSKGNVTDWGKLGQVIAEGTSDRLKAYQFVDPKLTFDTYYYRLKMWDLDGTYEYSEIRSITIAPNGQIEVYPNPADDHFYLNLSTLPPGTIHLSISNQLGNVVWEKTVDEEEEKLIRIDLQNPAFDNGVYGISLVHAQGKNSLKVVIEGKK